MNKYFYPHLPPSWIAASPMKTVAGTVFKWGNDLFPESPDSPKNARYDEDDIYYEINSMGYREKEFEESYHQYDELFLGFGNSSAAGTGVADKDVFLRLIEKQLSNVRVLNLSIAKGALDTVSRMVACTVPYFKPRCKKLSVIVMWPQHYRREVFLDDFHEAVTPWSQEPYKGYFRGIDETSCTYNREKNILLTELICQTNNVDLFTVPWSMYSKSISDEELLNNSARDGASPSPEWHIKFADEVLRQISERAQERSS